MAKFNAEEAENFEDIEKQFAVKAVHQMETYWKLLGLIKGSKLTLTKYDDEIYDTLLADFPEFKDSQVAAVLNEDDMKSKEGKERWRNFCEKFKHIEDYNFGTLLRTHSNEEYGEHNTMFSLRIQFYAIEIVRNRSGQNDWICKK